MRLTCHSAGAGTKCKKAFESWVRGGLKSEKCILLSKYITGKGVHVVQKVVVFYVLQCGGLVKSAKKLLDLG